jgi:hypothetical protein
LSLGLISLVLFGIYGPPLWRWLSLLIAGIISGLTQRSVDFLGPATKRALWLTICFEMGVLIAYGYAMGILHEPNPMPLGMPFFWLTTIVTLVVVPTRLIPKLLDACGLPRRG